MTRLECGRHGARYGSTTRRIVYAPTASYTDSTHGRHTRQTHKAAAPNTSCTDSTAGGGDGCVGVLADESGEEERAGGGGEAGGWGEAGVDASPSEGGRGWFAAEMGDGGLVGAAAFYVCLLCLPSMSALYVCLIWWAMEASWVLLPYISALCLPYVSAL